MEHDTAMAEMELGDEAFTDEQITAEIERFRNIVLSACSSLGNLEPVAESAAGASGAAVHRVSGTDMQYVPSGDCLTSLKDIKRYIQMDEQGDGKLVLQWLGEWEILERDIIPIFTLSVKRLFADKPSLALSGDDRDHVLKIVMMCVELFVFLTWGMGSESDEVQTRFIRILRAYKRAFARSEVVFSLLSVAVMYVRKSHNTDREALLIKGVLYVFRNTLAIPDPLISPASRGLSQLEVHDTLIAVLEKELAVDFFLTLMSSADQRRFKDLRPTLLDIIYYLFYRVPASALFSTQGAWFERSGHQRAGRHTKFGGVYAVSTGEGTVMPVFDVKEVLRPFANLFKKGTKIQKPRKGNDGPVDRQWRTVDPEAIPILRRIAAVFIESCFNPFVGVMFEDLKGATSVVNDVAPRLLYVAGYFVDISLANPAIDLGCTCVLVRTHTFGQVMQFTNTYLELKEWASLASAMYCIQQILTALSRMRGTKLDSLSTSVLSNLFYDGDALALFVKLCRVFRPTLLSLQFMEQVAQLADTFLNTLKAHAGSRDGMYVSKRMKKRSSRKKPGASETELGADTKPDADSADKPDADNPGSGGEMDDGSRADISDNEEETEEADRSEADAYSDDDDDAGGDSKTTRVERAFDFAKFENAFAVGDVVRAFTHLLAPPSAIEYVYPMLHRIAITCQRPHLFFRRPIMLRLLVLFNDSLSYPHRAEMLEVAAWIFRQYVTVMDSPALCNHYKAEPLNNRLADKCMRFFLATSSVGSSTEPVITRHIVHLLAADGQDGPEDPALNGASDSLQGTDGQDAPPEAAAGAPAETLDDFDLDDFDLDQYFALGDARTSITDA